MYTSSSAAGKVPIAVDGLFNTTRIWREIFPLMEELPPSPASFLQDEKTKTASMVKNAVVLFIVVNY
jgi:hypothetical protein